MDFTIEKKALIINNNEFIFNRFLRGRQPIKRLCVVSVHMRISQTKTNFSIKQKMR
jgi:hypothetical protein